MKQVGRTQRFDIEDVPPVRECDGSNRNHLLLEMCWIEQKKRNLLWCQILFLRPQLCIIIPVFTFLTLLPICEAYIAGLIAEFLTDPDAMTPLQGYLCALGLVVASTSHTVLIPYMKYQIFRLGTYLRTSMVAMVYKKILNMNSSSCKQFGQGEILTLISTDVETIADTALYVNLFRLLIIPVIGPVSAWLVYRETEWCGLSGVLFSYLLSVCLALLQPTFKITRGACATRTAKRLALTTCVIRCINAIKIYCWQKPFWMEIKKSRISEIKIIALSSALVALVEGCNQMLGVHFPQFVSILVCLRFCKDLTPKAFVRTIGYLHLSATCIVSAGAIIASAGNVIQSAKRIEKFLQHGDDGKRRKRVEKTNYDYDIFCRHLSAKWGNNFGHCLKCVNLKLKKGDLVIVYGQTGAGKTSLLMTLLGNTMITEGEMYSNSSVSYAPQEPWVFSGTIRENIIVGETFDEEWYWIVLDSCGLLPDIDSLPVRDLTVLGEKGINISGGQKSRISLARAVYSRKKLVLLDDPLSAVDYDVGKHIFERCIKGLLSDKTVLLVTHHLEFQSSADAVVFMKLGNAKLMTPGRDISNLQNVVHISPYPKLQYEKKHAPIYPEKHGKNYSLKETSQNGAVSFNVYKEFLRAGRAVFTLTPGLLFILGAQGLVVYWKWFMAEWIKTSHSDFGTNINQEDKSTIINIRTNYKIYNAIWASYFTATVLALILVSLFIIMANTKVHNNIFKFVIGAKMAFFNTPIGIILNRFSRDLGQLDIKLLPLMIRTIAAVSSLIAAVVFSWFTIPWMIAFSIPILIFTVVINKIGIQSIREFKRTEAVCRSPVFTHLSNTLDGHAIIKSSKQEQHFFNLFHSAQDVHASAMNIYLCAHRWSKLWNGVLAAGYLVIATVVAYIYAATGYNGTLAGIVLLTIAQSVRDSQNIPTQIVHLDMLMTCAERLVEYGELSQEDTKSEDKVTPPRSWPEFGKLTFQNVSLQYDNTDRFSLRNITFNLNRHEKIGIVGRTGAGKSSIFKALARLYDYHGEILLDGVDIKSISLNTLRAALSYIPQDPVMIPGSVRKNIDPIGQYTKDEIWRVLHQVQLGNFVRTLPLQLNTELGEAACGLSVGQKQLLCLARALLHKKKILILDEATANVDYRTDEQIQKTIQEEATDCTVLTIAHRIQTVMNYDKIMIISDGKIAHYDVPDRLVSEVQETLS